MRDSVFIKALLDESAMLARNGKRDAEQRLNTILENPGRSTYSLKEYD